MKTLGILLSSGIIALIVSSFVSVYLSRLGYKQKYYERIIDRRMSAHDELQALVKILKISVVDLASGDARSYHQIFTDQDLFASAYVQASSMNHAFWISDSTRKAHIDLNRELFRCHSLFEKTNDLIEVGKTEYKEIAQIRDLLEESLLRELPHLHKIDKFFKSKKVENEIVQEDVGLRPSEKQS